MRYRIRVVRTQVAERVVRATDEDSALDKVREELSRPYGAFVAWETKAVDVAGIDALPMTLGETVRVEGAPLLMSVKDAAIHLGIGRSTMYELINAGELPSLTLGRRRLVSREALNQFVEQMSRPAR